MYSYYNTALKAFMNSNPEKHVTLADLIMQKFEEKEAQNSTSNISKLLLLI
jgi:hypothetical protein